MQRGTEFTSLFKDVYDRATGHGFWFLSIFRATFCGKSPQLKNGNSQNGEMMFDLWIMAIPFILYFILYISRNRNVFIGNAAK